MGGEVAALVVPLLAKGAFALFTVLGSWAMAHLGGLLKAKTHNETVGAAFAHLQALVTATVEGLEQSTVGALRDSNGRLDDATAKLMRQRVLDKLNEIYGANGLNTIAGDLRKDPDATVALIGTLLEQAVLRFKQAGPIVVQGAPQGLPEFGGLMPGEVADNGVIKQ